MSYRVVTALVVAHTHGGDVYTYRDGVLPATVPAREIERLLADGFIEEVPDLEPSAEPDDDDGDTDSGDDGSDQLPDLEKLNLDELRKLAEEQSIDLAGATKKADIIAAIQAAHQ